MNIVLQVLLLIVYLFLSLLSLSALPFIFNYLSTLNLHLIIELFLVSIIVGIDCLVLAYLVVGALQVSAYIDSKVTQ